MFTKILIVDTRRFLAVVALVLGGASPALSQVDKPDLMITGMAAELVLGYTASMMIGAGMCTLGDREDWQKVVTAADKRYRFCVARTPDWSGLMPEAFKEEERQSLAAGQSRSYASFHVDRLLQTRGSEARAMGRETFCARVPWKLYLVPGAATPEAQAEWLKAHPQSNLKSDLKAVNLIRRLGTDPAWIEAPCDKEFWPPYIREDK